MSSDSISMVTGVMHPGGLTMSPPAVDGLHTMSEEDKFQERKRDILVLVMRFLADYGFLATYQTLCAEAATSLDQADAADNIDLMTIVQEFVDYYHSKFGRYPKLVRRNYLQPATFQMQQLQSQHLQPSAPMQQVQALQLQAAVAAAHAQVPQQSQPSQQQQAPPLSAALQMVPPQSSLPMSQPLLLSQQHVAVSMGMPLTGLPSMSQPLGALPLVIPQIPATSQPLGSDNSMQSAGSSPTHQQQQQHDCQSALLLQTTQQQPQPPKHQYMRTARVNPSQQQLAERLIPATAPVERVRVTFLEQTQGSTCMLGNSEAIDQVGFVTVLRAAGANELPSNYLSYTQPSKKSKRGSERFNLQVTDLQEEVMYALVGCSDVGWSSRNITAETREFLQKHYSIKTATITTFFKNRAQRKPCNQLGDGPNKRSKSGSCSGEAQLRLGFGGGAAAAAGGVLQDYSLLAMAAVAATPATPAATEQVMTTAQAAAAMAECDGLQDGAYGGLEVLGFRGLDGFCRQSSFTGLSTSMSLPCGLDPESYLGSDLDMTAAAMGMVASEICCSPCGFSS